MDRENKAVKEWQEKWSFIADYDPKVSSSPTHLLAPSAFSHAVGFLKGNLKEKKKMPERVNMYSDKLPSSCGHQYGHRIYTQEAQQITAMESSLAQNYRKRRNNDLICYD